MSYIKKHPTFFYFLLTFIISWGTVILISGGLSGFPKDKQEFQNMVTLFIPAVLGGPSISGLLMIGLVYGKKGYRELLSRLFTWKVNIKWYLIALFVGPAVLFSELLIMSIFSPTYLPGILTAEDKASRLIMGLVAGLVVGILEEVGWTGFATPQLRRRFSVFKTGLIVGVIWGGWHILLNVIWPADAYSGNVPTGLFILARGLGDLIGVLAAFRILMVWVYDQTKSLLVAMIMHFSLTAATIIGECEGISGTSLLIYDLVSFFVMWGVVLAFIFLSGRQKQFFKF